MMIFKVWRRTTPGYWMLGLRIVPVYGADLTIAQLAFRVVSSVVSASVLGFGFLGMVFHRHKQAWHDTLAGTYVVRTDARPIRETVDPHGPASSRTWTTTRTRLSTIGLGMAGGLIALLLVFAALFATLVAPYDPYEMNAELQFAAPTWDRPFGTDAFGRDVFTRCIYGARLTLVVGGIACLLGSTLGIILGVGSAPENSQIVWPTWLGRDGASTYRWVWFNVPWGIALLVLPVLGGSSSPPQLIVVLALSLIPYATLRARFYGLNEKRGDPGTAARPVERRFRLIYLSLLITQVGHAIFAVEMVNFFGLGHTEPTPSWGLMISNGFFHVAKAPWILVFPSMVLTLSILGFSIFGTALRLIFAQSK